MSTQPRGMAMILRGLPATGSGLRIGFIEPHLRRSGGSERVLEFGNRLTERGHEVTMYLPDDELLNCTWMPCEASIKTWSSGFADELDVILFDHEPHWHLLDCFVKARRRIYYALRSPRSYANAGSWECLRTPVDLQLASSNWTADTIAADIGVRPLVQLAGVNRELFQPSSGPKRYSILTPGPVVLGWRGADTVREAGRMLGVAVEEYDSTNLDRRYLAREYDAARVFAVDGWFEDFCQPGLEALACGVPLVVTDTGGCREYAIDGETALVVPPGDPVAMANAIRRLLNDEVLANKLVANGLDLVARDFDWEQRTDELADRLERVSVGSLCVPPPPRPDPAANPVLSVVTLAWDNLPYTQDFVESVHQHTDVPYELIIVDNGSAWLPANYAQAAADVAVMNETNLGFAKGMNQGLRAARGRYIAFCNNDTVLPEAWASRLLETAAAHPNAGIVVPAITEARNDRTVRSEPGEDVVVLPPFSAPPSGVLYLMPAQLIEEIEAWGEEYEIASGEDTDLAFKVWVNDLDIVFDERVLVAHVGKGSATRLDDWQALWARNRAHFLDKWSGPRAVPRIESCPAEVFARNRATARSVAGWMAMYFKTRDKLQDAQKVAATKNALKPASATPVAQPPKRSATADKPLGAQSAPPASRPKKPQARPSPTIRRKAARSVRKAMRRRPRSVGRAVRLVLACSPSYFAHRAREALRRA